MTRGWGAPPQIVALTGGGLARASGFAPFGAREMPAGLSLEDVVTREGFARDPARVHEFYNLRRRELRRVKPNAAHEALAVLEAALAGDLLVVTGNIDDLHERAGSKRVIHLQGELSKARCTICTNLSERDDDVSVASECPVCGNGGHLRPHIVWVGEEHIGIALVYEALAQCRFFLAIGVTGGSEPAASFLAAARSVGAHSVAFPGEDHDPVSSPAPFDELIAGALEVSVPQYVRNLIADG